MSAGRRRWKIGRYKFLSYVTIALILASILIPYLLVISGSFMSQSELFGATHLFPHRFSIKGWTQGFNGLKPFLINSTIAAIGTGLLSLLVTIPSAYAFGRREFPLKNTLFYLVIIAMMFPYIILIIPIASIWRNIGLYNTLPGLWIANQVFVTPFAIWVLRDFFEKLPLNLEEAAQVYGCSQFTAFVRVILPLSMPAVVAVGFLAALQGWQDFLFANILTISGGPQTAVVRLFEALHQGSGDRVAWGILMPQAIMVGVPPTVLYILSRRYLGEAFAVG